MLHLLHSFDRSPIWWCGEVPNVTYQGWKNTPAAAALQWLLGEHQNVVAGALQPFAGWAHRPVHASGEPVVSVTSVLLDCNLALKSHAWLTALLSPLPPFPMAAAAGTTARSAGQMQSPCSGCAKRLATWSGTARPARTTTPSPSSKESAFCFSPHVTCQSWHRQTQNCTCQLIRRVIAMSPCDLACQSVRDVKIECLLKGNIWVYFF